MEGCKNNYESEAVITERFGTNEKEMENCNNCPHLMYRYGIMTCEKIEDTRYWDNK